MRNILKFSFFIFSILFSINIKAQNNVGIGTNNPDANSILELSSTNKGLLIPRLTTLQRTAMNTSLNTTQTGLLVFDTNDNVFYFWNGTAWTQIGAGSAVCTTLDNAYNCGGNGAGRTITANYGNIQIDLSSISTNTEALIANVTAGTSGSPSTAIAGQNSAFGVSLYADNTNTANPYNSFEAHNKSTNSYTSAVAGYYDGNNQGVGVYGSVFTAATGGGVAGVMGVNARTDGGYGILGQGFNGIVGETNYQLGAGIWGQNNDALGSGNGCGVIGDGNYGVWGQTSTGTAGTFGINARTNGGWGVEGQGFNGVVGFTAQDLGFGVYGENLSTGTVNNNVGVAGLGWVGVFGESNDLATGFGVYSNGELGSSGTKSFVIDNPLDPENKFLKHFCIESPEVLNMYRGTATLNSNGETVITLPEYYNSINIEPSYELTPIGKPAPDLYIKEEIKENQFTIAGGNPNQKVSWTVYSKRNDLYVQKNKETLNVQPEKRANQKGKYLHPDLFGKSKEFAIFQHPELTVKTPQKSDSNLKKNISQPFLKKIANK
ncbi:MAG: hypothetical protein HY951_02010 [Bacteroidia bacterium]|nr:hypothetical protein [Bacteroidia bacterium]